jgi:hypothetical protein
MHKPKAFSLGAFLAGILACVGTEANAATILDIPIGDGSGFMMVSGKLELEDEKKFNIVAQRYNKGAVVFSSPGGNLAAGIKIGQIIRMRNFATGVAPNTKCASACALAWLGGTQRFMSSTSLIGFHAAFVVENGSPVETGLGNAIVGAYLTTLGLPLSAVIYISKSAPHDMTWLNVEDAKQTGIDVSLLDLTEQEIGNAKPVMPPAQTGNQKESVEQSRGAGIVPALKQSERWMVIASRGTLKDALSVAQQYKKTFPSTFITQSENGQYGIIVGRIDVVASPYLLTELIESKRVPKDSYLSLGKRFTSVAWQ